MKFVRFGPVGQEQPGALDAEGRVRDLSDLVDDWTPGWLSPRRLAALRAIDLRQLPLVAAGTRLGPPLRDVRQFLAIGLNYRQHAAEAGMPLPAEPVVFTKALGSIAGPDDDLVLPAESLCADWEVELGFVIGSRASRVAVADALSHVAGYCLANDISDREWQLERQGQWCKGKSFDGFGPIGPCLVTSDEVPDPQALDLSLRLNGEVVQSESTSDQVHGVAEVVAYLSRFMTLMPGDLVITGTPAGVGLGRKPPRYLRPGDVMELDGGILGRQRQRVIAPRP